MKNNALKFAIALLFAGTSVVAVADPASVSASTTPAASATPATPATPAASANVDIPQAEINTFRPFTEARNVIRTLDVDADEAEGTGSINGRALGSTIEGLAKVSFEVDRGTTLTGVAGYSSVADANTATAAIKGGLGVSTELLGIGVDAKVALSSSSLSQEYLTFAADKETDFATAKRAFETAATDLETKEAALEGLAETATEDQKTAAKDAVEAAETAKKDAKKAMDELLTESKVNNLDGAYTVAGELAGYLPVDTASLIGVELNPAIVVRSTHNITNSLNLSQLGLSIDMAFAPSSTSFVEFRSAALYDLYNEGVFNIADKSMLNDIALEARLTGGVELTNEISFALKGELDYRSGLEFDYRLGGALKYDF